MQIIDLPEEHKPLYFACLEDWSEEIKEAGDHKEIWYHSMKRSNGSLPKELKNSEAVRF